MEIEKLLKPHPIIPVLVIHDTESALPIAQALNEGGISIVEITLRTPAALSAIEKIKSNMPHMVVGAGTVLTEKQMLDVHALSIDFAVSPAFTQTLIKKSLELKLPFLGGAITPTEVLQASELGMSMLKFFPASLAGGPKMLKTLNSVFPHISFCPTGGITPETANDYFALPNVNNIGGSWLVTQQDIENQDWHAITKRARQALIQLQV